MIRAETQALIDGFAAAGLMAYVLALVLRRTGGPLTPRLVFLFGLTAVFYGLRSLAVRTDLPLFQNATFVVISLAPLAALWLAEGLLRRHAPRPLKLAVLAASIAALGFALFTTTQAPFGSRIGLAGAIILSLLAVLGLLWSRDRESLSRAENDTVRRLATGLAVVIPLIVTDFSELVPAPIGFSPVAALVIALLAMTNGESDARGVRIEAGLVLVAALALTCGLIERLGVQPLEDRVRLFALVAAAMITMTLAVRIRPFHARSGQNGLRRRLADADPTAPDALLAGLADDPLLKDLSVLGAPDLGDYDAAALAEALDRKSLWSRSELQAGGPGMVESGRDPLLDLLSRGDATHVGLLSRSPLQIGLVRVPELLRDTEAELDLALAFRMARLEAERRL